MNLINIRDKEGFMRKVYADNSATSFPKAPGVSDAIKLFLDTACCNVNRGSYSDAYNAEMELLDARQLIAELFHAPNARNVIFTPGVTYSLNMLLHGFLRSGDHVITTSMEHNAVMRPLHVLSKSGVAYDTVQCAVDGSLRAEDIVPLITKKTRAVVAIHASNVCGTVLPIHEVSEICKKHGLRFIVDAAQTAGVLDVDASAIDAVAFAGHKGLLAAQGIGGFIVRDGFADEILPIITGGTGSLSHELEQPAFLPDKFEPGTLNIPAILGLKKAVEYINLTGIKAIREKEERLTSTFLSKVRGLGGVRIVGKDHCEGRVSVVSLDFAHLDNAAVSATLDRQYGILTRCGLHCAPCAHKTLGTYPQGTVRFSFGHFNTMDEIEYIARSIQEILKGGARYGL